MNLGSTSIALVGINTRGLLRAGLKQRPVTVTCRAGGVEPTQCHHRRILSPLRLPIPPPPETGKQYFTISQIIWWKNPNVSIDVFF